MQLWALNVPITIMVDDWVPLREWGRDYTTWFAKISDDGAIWPAIMEKAFAKFHGNWSRIISGDSIAGISALNGSPSKKLRHNESSINEVWDMIEKYDRAPHRGMIVGGTPGSSDRETNGYGLVNNHAYPVLKAVTLRNG